MASVCGILIILTIGVKLISSCPVWQMTKSTAGNGGTSVMDVTTLNGCKTECVQKSECRGIDFTTRKVLPVHPCIIYNIGDNNTVTNDTEYNHYRLTKRCNITAPCPTWDKVERTRSHNGERAVNVTTLEQCQALCLRSRGCRVVDYHRNSVNVAYPCFIHDSRSAIARINSSTRDQYRLAAHCNNKAICPYWKRLRLTAGKDGVNVGVDTLKKCQTLCRRQANCKAIDFSIKKSEFPCVLYYEDDTINVHHDENYDHFRLAKPCRNPDACGMSVASPTIINTPISHFTGKTGEIVNGMMAKENSWPWTVHIVSRARRVVSKCGGSILNERWVISAAHCVQNIRHPSKVRLKFGVHRVSKYQSYSTIDRIVRLSDDHDIVLLRTTERIRYSFRVQPICLPEKLAPVDSDCFAVGWGKTQGTLRENYLNQLQLKSDHHTNCDDFYFCTKYRKNRNVCSGDSGGPLACKLNGVWRLYGVTQGVMVYKGGDRNCIAVNEPARFMRVLLYKSWILHTIQNKNRAVKIDGWVSVSAMLTTVAVLIKP